MKGSKWALRLAAAGMFLGVGMAMPGPAAMAARPVRVVEYSPTAIDVVGGIGHALSPPFTLDEGSYSLAWTCIWYRGGTNEFKLNGWMGIPYAYTDSPIRLQGGTSYTVEAWSGGCDRWLVTIRRVGPRV